MLNDFFFVVFELLNGAEAEQVVVFVELCDEFSLVVVGEGVVGDGDDGRRVGLGEEVEESACAAVGENN